VGPEHEMVAFLCKRAAAGRKTLAEATALGIFWRVDGVPNDVQKLAYAAFAAARTAINEEAVTAGFGEIVALEVVDYVETLEGCSPAQQRVLKALARAPETHVYSADFLRAVDVSNANAVRKALDVLSRRELVRRGADREWRVANPFFREWLKDPAMSWR